ncbi:hypothetical protein G7054_g1128 [Neopestalotiopsis clavispora]|nr:hypothetical protein G7054_g1128 [Neopestalotiopsis clavispora]
MAETFAVLVSVIGLLDVAGRTSAGLIDAIHAWRKCPSLLLALSNEVTDLKVILNHLAKIYQDPSVRPKVSNEELSTAIQGHVETIARHLRKLDGLIENLKRLKGSKQKLMLVYKKREVDVLERNLRDGRLKINNLLLIHNVVDVELVSVKTDLVQLRTQHQSDSCRFEAQLDEIQEQVILTTELVQSSQADTIGPASEKDCTPPLEDIPELTNHHDEYGGQLASDLTTRRGQIKSNEEAKACIHGSPEADSKHTHGLEEIEATQSMIPEVKLSSFPLQSILHEQSSVETLPDRGTTPLQYAIRHALSDSQMDLVEVLLRNGADPYMAGRSNFPVIAWVTELVLSNRIPQHISRRITELLPISAYIDDLGLCFLTKVILQLCPIDLKSVLESADDTILQQLESIDEIGRTPLHWAATLNDSQSARELLKAGAPVDALSAPEQFSALDLAIVPEQLSKDTSLIDALLEAGADVNLMDTDWSSPFSKACYLANVPTVRKLRQAGGDVNGFSSPLLHAADANRFDVMEYLLEEGANIEQVRAEEGSTALLAAVEENAHECIELLFRYKANYTHVNCRQETILHFAARGADLETIDILTKQYLRDLDLTARNSSGKTALEIHQLYGLQDPVITEAFKNLLHIIENKSYTNQCLFDEDIFYDAGEEWSASSFW